MERRGICYISRKEHFSSAHRLHSNTLSDEENRNTFGKCNWENGHGHNYEVKATIRGPINVDNGMVMNLVDLKKALQPIIEEFDHKHIDKDIEAFKKDLVSTAENISYYIFHKLKQSLPQPEYLFEVKVKETNNNIAYYRGEFE